MKTINYASLVIVGSTIIMVLLKITGVIKWSWWICFSPIITTFLLALILIIVAKILFSICERFENRYDDNIY